MLLVILPFPQRMMLHSTHGRLTLVLGISIGLLVTSGCKSIPGTASFQQSQFENEKLLSEFRAQKKRSDELQQRNDELAKRLNESERRLAQLQGTSIPSRLASTDLGRGSPTLGGNPIGLQVDPRLLPPGGSSNLSTSANLDSPGVLENSANGLKWRPSRRRIP